MKFTVSSSDLLKKLSISNGVIGSNTVLPILEDFLFTINNNLLRIVSSNLETTIITDIEVVAEGDGKVAVPAKILMETLRALPEQPLTFDINDETYAIQITSEYGKYKLAGDNSVDYPNLPSEEDVNSITMPSEMFARVLNNTLFATSNDELRMAMQGLFTEVEENKVTFAATDAHKLVKYVCNNIEGGIIRSFIVPRKGLNILKLALDSSDDLTVSFNTKNVFYKIGGTVVIIRLIDAKFPDYNGVIPTENPNLLTVSRLDFLSCLKRMVIFANKTTSQVILNLTEGSLTISSQDLDFANEATEQLSCTYEGNALNIGFNAKFLVEMLSVLKGENVELELSVSNRAGILLPVEKEENEDILMLVMPVMMGS
ncbi:MAG: DNA polymerase III subunit beta [Saprospiraceae bacterium]